jgi:hypothetical protein
MIVRFGAKKASLDASKSLWNILDSFFKPNFQIWTSHQNGPASLFLLLFYPKNTKIDAK